MIAILAVSRGCAGGFALFSLLDERKAKARLLARKTYPDRKICGTATESRTRHFAR